MKVGLTVRQLGFLAMGSTLVFLVFLVKRIMIHPDIPVISNVLFYVAMAASVISSVAYNICSRARRG